MIVSFMHLSVAIFLSFSFLAGRCKAENAAITRFQKQAPLGRGHAVQTGGLGAQACVGIEEFVESHFAPVRLSRDQMHPAIGRVERHYPAWLMASQPASQRPRFLAMSFGLACRGQCGAPSLRATSPSSA